MSEGKPAVHEALSAVMEDVRAVGKHDRNSSQGFNFRGIDAVMNAVGPALRKHGVVVLPTVLDHSYDTVMSRNGSPMGHVLVKVQYAFIGPAGDRLDCTVMGEGMDTGDKATTKAMSVAFRTALLQALTLPTDETDPDADTYERAEVKAKPQKATKTQAEGADDAKVSGLVDEFAAVQTEDDLKRVAQVVSGLDVGDEVREMLRVAYRDAKQRVDQAVSA